MRNKFFDVHVTEAHIHFTRFLVASRSIIINAQIIKGIVNDPDFRGLAEHIIDCESDNTKKILGGQD